MSVAELLIVLAVLGLVLTMSYLVFISATGISDATQAKSQAREAGMRTLDKLALDIRQAREAAYGNGAFAVWQPRECVFFADITHDRHPEMIRYYVSDGKLYRQVASPNTTSVPYTYGAYGPSQLMLGGIDPKLGREHLPLLLAG